MIKTSYVKEESFVGSDVYNDFYYHTDGGRSLVVIFPGSSYSCDRPLLHYARKIGLTHGHDVLCFSFGYGLPWRDKGQEIVDFQSEKCLGIVKKYQKNTYNNIYFISKSVGCEIAGRVSEVLGYNEVKNCFLTPIKEAIPYVISSKCMAVVGTKDEQISNEDILTMKECENVDLTLMEDAKHSLEIDLDVTKSLKILEKASSLMIDFIRD